MLFPLPESKAAMHNEIRPVLEEIEGKESFDFPKEGVVCLVDDIKRVITSLELSNKPRQVYDIYKVEPFPPSHHIG